MKFKKTKYASTLLYDEPNDHELAVRFLSNFFLMVRREGTDEPKYYVRRNWKHYFPHEFVIKHQLYKTRDHFEHSMDMTLFLYSDQENPIAFFEVGQVCGTVVTLSDGNRIKIFKSRHGKRQQRENDGVIQDFVDTYYPNVPLFRPEKSDCLDQDYLIKTYWRYM